jgi:hypothetical protein
VADFAATLTPDERATFAEGLKRRGQWRLPLQQRKAQQEKERSKAQDGQAASE